MYILEPWKGILITRLYRQPHCCDVVILFSREIEISQLVLKLTQTVIGISLPNLQYTLYTIFVVLYYIF